MRGRGLRPRSSNVARKNASSGERFAARVDSADSIAGVINNHRPCWFATSGHQSGSTRPVACGGVLRSSRVARVRNAPQPEPSPAPRSETCCPANICERRDSSGRRETARAGPSPEQLTELLRLCPRPGAKVSRAVEQFAGAAGFWPDPADL